MANQGLLLDDSFLYRECKHISTKIIYLTDGVQVLEDLALYQENLEASQVDWNDYLRIEAICLESGPMRLYFGD
jgi:hypothetical protein